jgi:hypothetical protein
MTTADKGTPIGVTDLNLNSVLDKGTPIGVKEKNPDDEESTKEDSDDTKGSE